MQKGVETGKFSGQLREGNLEFCNCKMPQREACCSKPAGETWLQGGTERPGGFDTWAAI